jgi:hypothetical protein
VIQTGPPQRHGPHEVGEAGLVTYEETAQWLPVDVRRAIEAALPPEDGHGTWAGFQRHRLRGAEPCYHCEAAMHPFRRRPDDG